MDKELLFLPETDSTNLELRRMAAEGADEGAAVWAARQTAGRGRLGRSFSSPEGGVYLSLLLRQNVQPERDLLLTPAAAVAAARAVERCCALRCGIKWPNDLLAGGRKLCGILTENFYAHGKRFLAIGIGVNLNTADFPAELREIAVSARQLTGRETAPEELARTLLQELRDAVAAARRGDPALLEEYRSRCLNLGRELRILQDGQSRPARGIGVNPDYSLAVELPDGSREDLRFGEVSIRFS